MKPKIRTFIKFYDNEWLYSCTVDYMGMQFSSDIWNAHHLRPTILDRINIANSILKFALEWPK